MNNPFKQGDKVRFVDNELNRAEINAVALSTTYKIARFTDSGLVYFESRWGAEINGKWHYSRFELVPQYAVGQYVKFSTPDSNGYGIIVGKTGNMWDIYALGRYRSRWELFEYEFVAVPPSEVIIDFGNGIKGTILQAQNPRRFMIHHSKTNYNDYSTILIDAITDPMKTIVTDLLAAQAKEASNA